MTRIPAPRTTSAMLGAVVLVLVLGLALALQGCGEDPAPPGAPGAAGHGTSPTPSTPYRGAVLILLDTVRADHLSCYGNPRPTTPRIDQLAADGVRFTQVVSSAPWTRPGVAAILSARSPGLTPADEDASIDSSVVESIADAGFATGAVTEGAYVSRQFGMNLGFGEWVEEEGSVVLPKAGQPPEASPKGGIEHTFTLAKHWLSEHRERPFFLLVHTYEVHAPYTNREFAAGMKTGVVGGRFSINLLPDLQSGKLALQPHEIEYVRALYDGDLKTADRYVGELVDHLQQIGLYDGTLVVVTSDHGEELGEHFAANIGDHGHSLHDELLLVPLVVRDPRHRFAAKLVGTQARTIDVLPTIADLLGAPIRRPIDGASLVPLMDGSDRDGRPVLAGWNRKGVLRFALRQAGFKYMMDVGHGAKRPLLAPPPAAQLFDLEHDPGERTDLLAAKPAVAQAMRDALEKRLELVRRHEAGHSVEIDQALRERLGSLGYGK